jgi:hypothetical protein
MTFIHNLVHSPTFWTAVAALLQGAAAVIAYAALHYSLTTFTTSLQVSNYTELDRMYFDLLQMAVNHPHLADPDAKRTHDEQRSYETYAFMVWNVMESIYDRCHTDNELCETWYPVIDTEERRHRKWFDDPKNRAKFKDRFYNFICERYQHPARQDHHRRV